MSECCRCNTNKKNCLKVSVSLEEISSKKKRGIKAIAKLVDYNLYVDAYMVNKDIKTNVSCSDEIQVFTGTSSPMKVSFGILCSASSGWEYLYVSEGQILTINGEKVLVRKKPVES